MVGPDGRSISSLLRLPWLPSLCLRRGWPCLQRMPRKSQIYSADRHAELRYYGAVHDVSVFAAPENILEMDPRRPTVARQIDIIGEADRITVFSDFCKADDVLARPVVASLAKLLKAPRLQAFFAISVVEAV